MFCYSVQQDGETLPRWAFDTPQAKYNRAAVIAVLVSQNSLWKCAASASKETDWQMSEPVMSGVDCGCEGGA